MLAGIAASLIATAARADGYTHDGLQIRGAIGFGYLSDSESTGNVGSSLHGGAGTLELYIGGTPVRGLVIGGFVSGATAFGPDLTAGGVTVSDSNVSASLFTIGPYIDFYPDPRRGLHFLGTLGFAKLRVTYDAPDASTEVDGSGFTIGGGVGYDWWVSSDWSIGILGRLTFASTSWSTGAGPITVTTHDNIAVPALLFSVAYN